MLMRRHPVALIVDDDGDTAEMYAMGLSIEGFESMVALSGGEGLRVAMEALPDVVITDYHMGGPLDGLNLARHLRDEPRTHHIPIVVVTGSDSDDDRKGAAGAGCNLFLTKPCLPDRLAAAVRTVLPPCFTVAS
jgi:two-component system, cell cycle response regulator DivK